MARILVTRSTDGLDALTNPVRRRSAGKKLALVAALAVGGTVVVAPPTATPASAVAAQRLSAADHTSASTASKGAGVWQFPGIDTALSDSGAHWYYNWGTNHSGIATPTGVEYVPMIWGARSVNKADLAAARSASGNTVLTFNEPDQAGQADLTVKHALDAWPKLEATGLKLSSPATASGGESAGSWLAKFMKGAKKRGYRVDFIALHWYRWDGSVDTSVTGLRTFLTKVHNRYNLPIWLTEFSAVSFSDGVTSASVSDQASFLKASGKMMAKLRYVKRYAWFALPPMTDLPNSSLYSSGPKITRVGKAFRALP